jgi:hypothetical protein
VDSKHQNWSIARAAAELDARDALRKVAWGGIAAIAESTK